MRGGHCLKVWTKKQQVGSLTTAESEMQGIQSVAKDLVIACRLIPHLDASATMCLVNRGVLGKAKHAKTCGYRRHPSQKGSSRRKWARA